MVDADTFTSFFLPDEEVLIMSWNERDGWKLLAPHNKITMQIDPSTVSLDMLKRKMVEEDILVYDLFLRRLEAQTQKVDTSHVSYARRVNVVVRLHNVRGGMGYYRVDCFLKTGSQGEVSEILTMVYELTSDEIYRIRLAQSVTSDRNPQIFMKQAEEMVRSNPNSHYAVIQFDIAKFKAINEMYGESVGDELLNYFNGSLKVICRKEQLYVRISADVFMILTPYQVQEDIEEFVNLITESLSGYKGMTYRIVFGISWVKDVESGFRKYVDAAAVARQSVKDDALNYYAFYEDDMKENIITKKFIEDNMQSALDNREFVMYLQPQFSISQNRMVGAEALIRWIHPVRGMLSPMDFIPLFKKNGFIIKMDEFMWEEACKTIRGWIDRGISPIPISVNVSRRHLKNLAFIDVLNELVEKYHLDKKYLEIEITETVLGNEIEEGVSALKKNGFTLLMDDFGSGYSSLNMLKDTKFDIIKMDRGFLFDFIGSKRGESIVEHTIHMSQDIGLDMVAEGVETKEQADFLQSCGCDTAQGYYYARPMPVEEFNAKFIEFFHED